MRFHKRQQQIGEVNFSPINQTATPSAAAMLMLIGAAALVGNGGPIAAALQDDVEDELVSYVSMKAVK